MEKRTEPRAVFSRIVWWPRFIDRVVIAVKGYRQIVGYIVVKCPDHGYTTAFAHGRNTIECEKCFAERIKEFKSN